MATGPTANPLVQTPPLPLPPNTQEHILDALVPYLGVGFGPSETPGWENQCGTYAIVRSLEAVRNLTENLPAREHISNEAAVRIIHSAEFARRCRHYATTVIGLAGVFLEQYMAEFERREFFSSEQLKVLLDIMCERIEAKLPASERVNLKYRLGVVQAGGWREVADPKAVQSGPHTDPESQPKMIYVRTPPRASIMGDTNGQPVVWIFHNNGSGQRPPTIDHWETIGARPEVRGVREVESWGLADRVKKCVVQDGVFQALRNIRGKPGSDEISAVEGQIFYPTDPKGKTFDDAIFQWVRNIEERPSTAVPAIATGYAEGKVPLAALKLFGPVDNVAPFPTTAVPTIAAMPPLPLLPPVPPIPPKPAAPPPPPPRPAASVKHQGRPKIVPFIMYRARRAPTAAGPSTFDAQAGLFEYEENEAVLHVKDQNQDARVYIRDWENKEGFVSAKELNRIKDPWTIRRIMAPIPIDDSQAYPQSWTTEDFKIALRARGLDCSSTLRRRLLAKLVQDDRKKMEEVSEPVVLYRVLKETSPGFPADTVVYCTGEGDEDGNITVVNMEGEKSASLGRPDIEVIRDAWQIRILSKRSKGQISPDPVTNRKNLETWFEEDRLDYLIDIAGAGHFPHGKERAPLINYMINYFIGGPTWTGSWTDERDRLDAMTRSDLMKECDRLQIKSEARKAFLGRRIMAGPFYRCLRAQRAKIIEARKRADENRDAEMETEGNDQTATADNTAGPGNSAEKRKATDTAQPNSKRPKT